jgi:hypothetical protein
MPITLGNTTITGLGVGGLPAGTVNADSLASAAVTRAKIGYAGAILQVVQSIKTAPQTFSGLNTTFADISDLSLAITPSSTSSKILILGHIYGSSQGNPLQLKIQRNSTDILVGDAASSRKRALTQPWGGGSDLEAFSVSPAFLDSPSTTSAVTYKFQISIGGSSTNHINRSNRDNDGSAEDARGASSIILMEVAG